jgi:hypothetical protein
MESPVPFNEFEKSYAPNYEIDDGIKKINISDIG